MSQLNTTKPFVLNVGAEDKVNVKTIAQIIAHEMGLENVRFRFTGGVDGRGWIGDVRTMLLDTSKLRNLGWKPKYDGQEAVELTVKTKLRRTNSIKN
jgi:UDP-glucose 4-epimerase